MKILIADDEMLVRVGIKTSIDWDKYGMEVVGEASDGDEALRLVKELKPDVLLLDIKMPMLDGIGVMKRLKYEGNKCKVIVLSGFDDFVFVKEAMKLGAVDYFHKPLIKPEDIFSALITLKQTIKNEYEESRFEIGNDRTYQKEMMLKELVAGTMVEDLEEFEKVGICLGKSKLRCIIFSVLKFDEVQKRYVNSEKGIFEKHVKNMMVGVLSSEKQAEFLIYDRNLFLLIISHDGNLSEGDIYREDSLLINAVRNAMKQFLNVDIVMGVSCIAQTISKIKEAYLQADEAIKKNFFSRKNKTIYYYEVQKNDEEVGKQLEVLIENGKRCLTKKAYKEFESLVDEIVDLLQVSAWIGEFEVKKLFMGFLFMCDKSKTWLAETEEISKCDYICELSDFLKKLIHDKYLDNEMMDISKDCNLLIKEVLSFVNENYSRDITLGLLCEKFNISYSYLSRQLNKAIGKSLYSYLNEVRIEHAKKLLKNPTLRIYEVADKVGFKSTVHFNIVFSKSLGVSP